MLGLAKQLPELFEIAGVACQTPSKHKNVSVVPDGITNDAASLAGSGVDVVVELIGGVDIPLVIAHNALANQSHFVTANKALIAEQGDVIKQLAQKSGRRVLASASVGGVAPVLESLRLGSVKSVQGVLNGTGNFVLGALKEGSNLSDAVNEAQRIGFAETDPSRDLDGRDSLDKLLVIAKRLGGRFRMIRSPVNPSRIGPRRIQRVDLSNMLLRYAEIRHGCVSSRLIRRANWAYSATNGTRPSSSLKMDHL